MMMHRSPASLSESAFRRCAYSMAVAGSWMEHGPTTTNRRSSRCSMISMAWFRPDLTVSTDVAGYSD